MKHLHIGSVGLSDIPKITAVVTKLLHQEEILKIKNAGADIIELRVDKILKNPEEIIDSIKKIKKIGLPVICTIRRDVWLKQYGKDSEENRLKYFELLIPYVDAVDIEYEARKIRDKVISLAKGEKKLVIFSYHNFKNIPSDKILKSIYDVFKSSDADVLKIAGYARDIDDVMRLMIFIKRISELNPVIGIAMGKVGEFTRIYGGLFGSCLTYGYVDKKVAPGQLSLRKLRKEIDRIYR